MSIWDEFDQGLESGDRIGGQIRNARAYREGGLDAVGEAAGRVGDLQGMETAREMQRRQARFTDERMQNAYERMEQIAPWARNVVRVTRNMDPQRAGAFLSRPDIRQRFLDWGFSEEQLNAGIAGLANPDPAVRQQWQEELESAFTQHQNPEWRIAGDQVVGINQETGEVQLGGQLPEQPGEWQAGYGRAYRINPDGTTELGGSIPQAPRTGTGAYGPGAYSIVDPAEVEALGLPPGSYQRNNATGQITVLGRQRGQYTNEAGLSAQFASRMAASDATLNQLEDAYTDPAGVFAAQSGFGNQYERQARQAQREFVNAILRRESGAAIADSEFNSAAQQYFPQPGDGPDVIAQKRAARQRAIQGLINSSQGAYEEWYGEGSGAEINNPAPIGSVIGAEVGRTAPANRPAPAPTQAGRTRYDAQGRPIR